MIESGNVVCACVPVCVLIKGCSTRYDIIPQIKNRANSKLRQKCVGVSWLMIRSVGGK